VRTSYEPIGNITLLIANLSLQSAKVSILDNYTGQNVNLTIGPGATASQHWSLSGQASWYEFVITVDADRTIEYHLGGHVETGKDSISDPAIAAS
jgi:phospholipase C